VKLNVKELEEMAKIVEEVLVTTLLTNKHDKPPLLGKRLDIHLQQLVLSMRLRGYQLVQLSLSGLV